MPSGCSCFQNPQKIQGLGLESQGGQGGDSIAFSPFRAIFRAHFLSLFRKSCQKEEFILMLVAKLGFGRIFGRFFGRFLMLLNRPPGQGRPGAVGGPGGGGAAAAAPAWAAGGRFK